MNFGWISKFFAPKREPVELVVGEIDQSEFLLPVVEGDGESYGVEEEKVYGSVLGDEEVKPGHDSVVVEEERSESTFPETLREPTIKNEDTWTVEDDLREDSTVMEQEEAMAVFASSSDPSLEQNPTHNLMNSDEANLEPFPPNIPVQSGSAKLKEDGVKNKKPAAAALAGSSMEGGYKCPFCFIPYAEANALIQHLPAHKVKILASSLSSSSLSSKTGNLPKVEGHNIPKTSRMRIDDLPPCTISLTRCDDNLIATRKLSKRIRARAQAPSSKSKKERTKGNKRIEVTNNDAMRIAKSTRSRGRPPALKSNANDNLHKCGWCPKVYTQSHNLNAHIRAQHTGERPYECGTCSKGFSSHAGLKNHSLVHMIGNENGKRKRLHECPECQDEFISQRGLKGHMLMQHREEKNDVKPLAEVKEEKTSTVRNDSEPPQKRVNQSQLPPCWVKLFRCDEHILKNKQLGRLKTDESLEETKSTVESFSLDGFLANLKPKPIITHPNRKPFRCTVCAKTFSCRQMMEFHMFKHTKEKIFKCPICPKSFTQPGNVNLHIRTHTREKPYKCGTCSKAFSQLSHLQNHIPTHQAAKPYKCARCSKGFSQLSNLKVHMYSHTGQKKPHKCPTCSGAFVSSGHLKIHIRSHTGERPYKCPSCTKAYSRPEALKVHIRGHTGERPYHCSKCSKTYKSGSALRQHHVRIHQST